MGYYFSVFLRRLPYFLIVATMIAAMAVVVAVSLPAAYVSEVRLVLEKPQIPTDLATSTVTTPTLETMQLLEQRLLTRANMLDIARRLDVLSDIDTLNPDEIVSAMRSRTTIRTLTGASAASIMTLSFEARSGQKSAAVLNEYLTLILQDNVEFRVGRAGQTQEFFQQEVDRLSGELDTRSKEIITFKTANADALPESLGFRLSRQSSLEERLSQNDREVASLRDQRDRMVQIFESTGRVEGVTGAAPTAEERELERLRQELSNALLVYSAENPRIKVLKARVSQMESALTAGAQASGDDAGPMSVLDVQLAQIDTRIEILQEQRALADTELQAVTDSIARTPANGIALEGLERGYNNIQNQYNQAIERLSRANTGERIELLSRGQRISVLEQPTVPNRPTRPNRILIAGGGGLIGIMAGLALVVLMEVLNTTARRPVDLVNKLGISPITTIPYIRTKGEVMRRRLLKLALVMVILIGVPATIYAVHAFYQPLDVLAERVMNKLGMRW